MMQSAFPPGAKVDLLDARYGWRGSYAVIEPCQIRSGCNPCPNCYKLGQIRIKNLKTDSVQHAKPRNLRPGELAPFSVFR